MIKNVYLKYLEIHQSFKRTVCFCFSFWVVLKCVPAKRAATTLAKMPAPHTISTVNTFSIQVKINETFLNQRRYALEWNHKRNQLEFSTLCDEQNIRTKSLHPCYAVCILLLLLARTISIFPSWICWWRTKRKKEKKKHMGMDSLYACIRSIRLFIPYFSSNASPANYVFVCIASVYSKAYLLHTNQACTHNNHNRNKNQIIQHWLWWFFIFFLRKSVFGAHMYVYVRGFRMNILSVFSTA